MTRSLELKSKCYRLVLEASVDGGVISIHDPQSAHFISLSRDDLVELGRFLKPFVDQTENSYPTKWKSKFHDICPKCGQAGGEYTPTLGECAFCYNPHYRETGTMSDAVRKASEIAHATEWSGDPRVNFLTAINAAKVLHKEVERLREVSDE